VAYFVARRFTFEGGRLQALRGDFTWRGVSQPLELRAQRYGCREAVHEGARVEVCGGDFEGEVSRSEYGATFALPLVGDLVALPSGETAAYVSEAMVLLYGAEAGQRLDLPLPDGRRTTVFVRGVWRDYARQHGAVVLATVDWQRLTDDTRINDAALWLRPSADAAAVQRALRELAGRHGMNGELLEFASPGEIRALSLRIFDRSFAVTYWLQGVAIAIGLFGIAASFSAQVMARRKEFGLLAHLGLTRRQVLTVVTAEGAVWTAVGALLGLGLGIAVSVVLVKVVNPQSFHWTMDLLLPWSRLAMLCAAVIAAGTLTAGLAARRAASRSMVSAMVISAARNAGKKTIDSPAMSSATKCPSAISRSRAPPTTSSPTPSSWTEVESKASRGSAVCPSPVASESTCCNPPRARRIES
jgi:hypothetical protein